MKRTCLSRGGITAFFLLLFLFPALRGAGLELTTRFDLGNLGFAPDRASADTTYSGTDYYWGGSVEVTHGFSERMALRAGFSRDTVLRNLAYAMLYYNLDYLSMGIGTIQGFNNTGGAALKPGLASSVQLTFPGVMFARLTFDTSLGSILLETGDYLQNRNELAIGFYVPNAICSLSLQSKKFYELQALQGVVDSLMRYSFQADIFQKNAPYRLLFSLAYQTLQKKFIDGLTDPVHTLSSLLAGVELSIDLTRFLTILLGVDSALLTFGEDQLAGLPTNPAPGGYLFQAHTGIKLNFENLKTRRRSAAD
jgi:hypothetical protein